MKSYGFIALAAIVGIVSMLTNSPNSTTVSSLVVAQDKPTLAPTLPGTAQIGEALETEMTFAEDVQLFEFIDKVGYVVIEPLGKKKVFLIEITGQLEDILVFRHNPGNSPPIGGAQRLDLSTYMVEGEPGTTFTLWVKPKEGPSQFKSYTFSGNQKDPPQPDSDDTNLQPYKDLVIKAKSQLDQPTISRLIEAYEKILSRPPTTLSEARTAFVNAYGNLQKDTTKPWFTAYREPLEEQFKKDKPNLKAYLAAYKAIVESFKSAAGSTSPSPDRLKAQSLTLKMYSPDYCTSCDNWKAQVLPALLKVPGLNIEMYRGNRMEFKLCTGDDKGTCVTHDGYWGLTSILSEIARITEN